LTSSRINLKLWYSNESLNDLFLIKTNRELIMAKRRKKKKGKKKKAKKRRRR